MLLSVLLGHLAELFAIFLLQLVHTFYLTWSKNLEELLIVFLAYVQYALREGKRVLDVLFHLLVGEACFAFAVLALFGVDARMLLSCCLHLLAVLFIEHGEFGGRLVVEAEDLRHVERTLLVAFSCLLGHGGQGAE